MGNTSTAVIDQSRKAVNTWRPRLRSGIVHRLDLSKEVAKGNDSNQGEWWCKERSKHDARHVSNAKDEGRRPPRGWSCILHRAEQNVKRADECCGSRRK